MEFKNIFIQGDAKNAVPMVRSLVNNERLVIITDPPYGGNKKVCQEPWNNSKSDPKDFAENIAQIILAFGAETNIVFQGIGTHKNRPIWHLINYFEQSGMELINFCTWSKLRAIGTEYNYSFTREEILWFEPQGKALKERVFHKPYLNEERTCEEMGKGKCKSKFKRRTNVWLDFAEQVGHLAEIVHCTEILQKLKHKCEKPRALLEMLVRTHSNPGDFIVDPFCGSRSLAPVCKELNRNFIGIDIVNSDLYHKVDQILKTNN